MYSEFVSVFSEYAAQVLPWFVVGLIAATIVEKRFGGKALPSYFRAYHPGGVALLLLAGMISPLSVLSGLPLAALLIRQGAHPALLLSFFAAERVYDLHSFPIIGSIFGWTFAATNALIVFVALFAASWAVKDNIITYREHPEAVVEHNIWKGHAKMLLVVMVGIAVAALFRVLVPSDVFLHSAGSFLGSVVTALLLGFFLYVGTIAGNYPLASAFSELGMHTAGLMTFLSASSLLNVVIALLFASSISPRAVAKYFLIYGAVATILSICFGVFVY